MAEQGESIKALCDGDLNEIYKYLMKYFSAPYYKKIANRKKFRGDQATGFAQLVMDIAKRIRRDEALDHTTVKIIFESETPAIFFDVDMKWQLWEGRRPKRAWRRIKKHFISLADKVPEELKVQVDPKQQRELFTRSFSAFQKMVEDKRKRVILKGRTLVAAFQDLLRKRYEEFIIIRDIQQGGAVAPLVKHLDDLKRGMLAKHPLLAGLVEKDEHIITSLFGEMLEVVITNLKAGRFRQDSSLRTYSNEIFNNKCIDYIRKATKHQRDDAVDPVTLPDSSSSSAPAASEIDVELLRMQLYAKVKPLGKKCRDLLESLAEYIHRFDSKSGFDTVYANESGEDSSTISRRKNGCLEQILIAPPSWEHWQGEKGGILDALMALYRKPL